MAIASKILRSFVATTTIFGVGCAEKCGFIKNSGSTPSSTVGRAQPRPATWPPASETASPSKSISPAITPKVESAAAPIAPVEPVTPNASLQPVGAQIPPPAPVSESGPSNVIQAQRLETVPAVKKGGTNMGITPASNPDASNLPLIPASSSTTGGPGSTLVVPPPPPGSPLSSSAPLGIPSAPAGSPNR